MSFDWQIRIPGPSIPTVPVRVLDRDYLAWEWKDVPEERRKEIVFARLEDDLQVHPAHLEKIQVLSRQDSASIAIHLRRLNEDETLTRGKSIQVKTTGSKIEEREIRAWLFGLGISFQTPVVVLQYFDEVAMLTTWKMVVRYFEIWEWVSTDVWVFDEMYTWAVFFNHEDWISFHSRNPQ
jgi:hypothetical protein